MPIFLKRAFIALLCGALLAGSAAAEPSEKPAGPVLTVHFDYYAKDLAQIRVLERRLEKAIKSANAGELGETEFHLDGDDAYLYMYGPDPDRLYAVVSPILKPSKLMTHAEVTKNYASHTETFLMSQGDRR